MFTTLSSVFWDALVFASEAHKHQMRKSGGSFFCHPIRVAEKLASEGCSEAVVVAGLLHDTVEDTHVTEEQLRSKFGDQVTNLVMELSDNKLLDKVERKKLAIEHASKLSKDAARIKLADVEDNRSGVLGDDCPKGWSSERIAEYGAWSMRIIEECHKVLYF